ncbi:hypothetical protein L210DRAFT_3652917 [Boletus edulis BED1]|uniref:Uncharacterized protein n=1 Tax=Boletus edulis BED1 TaxID=1328754 RepID=A0AAD4G860_BOLED|nr:hypothetical protein L210DRAFT_3652917 [Boletus edulis BED1]
MHSGASQGAAHRSSAIEDATAPTDASKKSNSESRNQPKAPQPVPHRTTWRPALVLRSPELRRSADMRARHQARSTQEWLGLNKEDSFSHPTTPRASRIHTQHERDLFRARVAASQLFAGPNLPGFIAVARDMNAHADGRHAFYKRIRGLLTSQAGTPSSALTTAPKPLVETIRAPAARSQTEANAGAVMDQRQLTKVLTKHQLARSALQYRCGDQPEPAPECTLMQVLPI